MKLWDLLFGDKYVEIKDPAVDAVTSPPDASFCGGRAAITSIGFTGSCKMSDSGEWVICWCDHDLKTRKGGQRDSGHGCYILYSCRESRIHVQGLLERPNNGCVGNNGFFSMDDWHFGNSLKDSFNVFNQSGEKIYSRIFNGKILKSAISPGGALAACQTAGNACGADGNRIYLVDLQQGVELFSVPPRTGVPDNFEFDEAEKTLVAVHRKIGKFRYDRTGRFLDEEPYDLSRLNCPSYSVVLLAAEEILQKPDLRKERVETVLDSILRARESGAEKDKGWRVLSLKLQGIALETLGRDEEALRAYEEVIGISSRAGVKRRADALRERLRCTEEVLIASGEEGASATLMPRHSW